MTNEVKNVPELRFPNFSEEWKKFVFKDQIISIEKGTDLLGSEDNMGIPLIKMGNIKRGYFSFNKLEKLREIETIQEKYYIKKGDFLFNTRNTMELVGKSATWTNKSGKFAFNSNIARLVLKDIDTYFFNYLYNTSKMINKVKSLAVGTTSVAAIYPRDLNHLNYFLPLIAEQEKIGEFFSKLDRQIELEEQKLEKLEEQKKGYMQKIFSQELRFKNENGNNYPDWEVKKIGEIMDVASVKRIHQSDWTNEGVKFIRARDIVSRYKGKIVENPLFISKERYEEYSKLSGKVKIGDLLVTGVGTIGVPLLINSEKPIYFKDGNIIWLKNEDNIDKNFLFYSFISRKTQNFIKSVAGIGTVGTYTISNAKKTPILLPVSIEQVKIGNFFNELDKSIKKQNKKVDLLKERKKGFLQKMFI
ncbi:restriction endonuclease subunit S [Staphylococcus saprophyticus]|uniref:restriction endonuclease subunit S n=1 Tax=Staphylococcus saprophyticus TaxID=29385 RepID=UPI0011A7F3AA|nr:restriction endonuclease subunit S [Staphylococcus saprophyticus]MDW4206527.1 restriction endonuclease subunit S [Staphylococcus saprophyticus]